MKILAPRAPRASGLASLEDWAYSQIKESIITLALKPETTLVEAQLAEQLGVSKTPLRAALLQLERERFIVSIPYKGSYVAPITPESIRQLYELREAVEGYAVRRAAQTFTAEDFATLEALIGAQEQAAAIGDTETVYLLDARFHSYFVNRLHNERFDAMACELADHRRRLRHAMAGLMPDNAWVSESHREVLEAVRGGDPILADQTTQKSMRRFLEWADEAGRRGAFGPAATDMADRRGDQQISLASSS